ncbi:MAG TPA: UDP-N-acetylmuramoyl-tripeptide--D-alanyl-D-alanine ligase, partial [Candidatus Latescibacteria bacterium]|nr:UDP-N-acetylmuramoyl-tripeptide--D-alanyl-D-alanine ligase [Candidatus Latescibacterota bacterium]
MKGITLDDVRRWTRGDWRRPEPGMDCRPARGICTDSRSIARGEVFAALRGPDFDGHEFVDGAFQRGASAAIVERAWMAGGGDCRHGPLLAVDSPLAALGVVARENRKRFCL